MIKFNGNIGILLLCLISISNNLMGQKFEQFSGGVLSENKASFDIKYYDLNLEIFPDTKSISGSNIIHMKIVNPVDFTSLDLDDHLTVDSVFVITGKSKSMLEFKHIYYSLIISFPQTVQSGNDLFIQIFYHGQPRIAPNPPWQGGFSWKKTNNDDHWIGVSCQIEGADLWWPCKDHPSDEPDSMSLTFTYPENLVCVSNGVLIDEVENNNHTKTSHWFVNKAINNYGVSLYLAPYKTLKTDYESVSGETFPVTFWYLDYGSDIHEKFFPYITKYLRFLENTLGSYPFRHQKLGVAQTSYKGMEHQSIIAYGDIFNTKDHIVFFHELTHEWFGNWITAGDWKDIWIHEGFATYLEWLYLEKKYGINYVYSIVSPLQHAFQNEIPVASRDPRSINDMYSTEVYRKGAYILHTLRYLIGKEVLLNSLKSFLYPDSIKTANNQEQQCRLVDIGEYIDLVNSIANKNLDWFFDSYLYKAELPTLYVSRINNDLELYWNSKENPDFFMPVDIVLGKDTIRVDMSNGYNLVHLNTAIKIEIDPNKWVLKEIVYENDILNISASDSEIADFVLEQNYPNPFNASTFISYFLPDNQNVNLNLYNIKGELIQQLVSDYQLKGWHTVKLLSNTLPSGTLFYELKCENYSYVKSLLLLK